MGHELPNGVYPWNPDLWAFCQRYVGTRMNTPILGRMPVMGKHLYRFLVKRHAPNDGRMVIFQNGSDEVEQILPGE